MEHDKLNKPPKEWLWLEDENSTLEDILTISFIRKLKITRFSSPDDLIEFLIGVNRDPNESLNNYGLIMDVMLKGHPFLYVPKEWSGNESKYVVTNKGSDAGFVFIEQLILNGVNDKDLTPFWNPPPAILILTIMSIEFEGISNRLKLINRKWTKYNNCSPADSKVEYIRKWDATNEVFQVLFDKWYK